MKKWAYLLVGLNIFDGISTYAGMKMSLIGEKNPLLAWMPPEGIILIKLLLSMIFLQIVMKVNLKKPVFKYSLIIGNCMYLFTAALHFYWLTYVFAPA
ncbi:DUF5658 family protein [Bacillus sp. B-jedd]|uniref:DUF5658 family protein n=1 Tax=Bacillus sp. B-jedd TaxID=1476857 RepID=UPI000661FC08|nr:DUF5658 family protein [Bacillus sp. B-jedd]